MYHSITFGDKNTYDDWHLAPTSRPVFDPPKPKVKYLDIPGASGAIDMTESLTSFPLYEDREGSFEFYVLNGYQDWQTLYSEIMNYLHGRKMFAIMEDDLSYHYEGRFSVDKWKSEAYWSKITIKYKVNPYKWTNQLSTDDWIWDTFNFETDTILTTVFNGIVINTSGTEWDTHIFNSDMYGTAPVSPKFICSNTIKMRFINESIGYDETYTLNAGINELPEILFCGNECKVMFQGNSSVSIEFYKGKL